MTHLRTVVRRVPRSSRIPHLGLLAILAAGALLRTAAPVRVTAGTANWTTSGVQILRPAGT